MSIIFCAKTESPMQIISTAKEHRASTNCIFKESQLTKWATDSAQKFFSTATRYEDKRNVRYRETELSLPNELILEQNLEIVDRFIARHLQTTITLMRYTKTLLPDFSVECQKNISE